MASHGERNTIANRLTLTRRAMLQGIVSAAATLPILATESPLSAQERKKETETFKSALKAIVKLVTDVYADNQPTTIQQSASRRQQILGQILHVLESNNIEIAPGENSLDRVMATLRTYGYVFAISPFPVENQRFIINAPFLKLGNSSEEALSIFEFPNIPRINERVLIYSVTTTLIPDVRETHPNPSKQIIQNGMTITDPQSRSTVLIFEENLKRNAGVYALSVDAYRETVVANEIAQVYFQKILSRDFPDINFLLGLPLTAFGITTGGRNWNVFQLQEAFSDWASLKYGKTFTNELERVLTTRTAGYDFSNTIAIAAFRLAIENDQLAVLKKPRVTRSDLLQLSPAQQDMLKEVMIENYEANLNLVISGIRRSLPALKQLYEERKK